MRDRDVTPPDNKIKFNINFPLRREARLGALSTRRSSSSSSFWMAALNNSTAASRIFHVKAIEDGLLAKRESPPDFRRASLTLAASRKQKRAQVPVYLIAIGLVSGRAAAGSTQEKNSDLWQTSTLQMRSPYSVLDVSAPHPLVTQEEDKES